MKKRYLLKYEFPHYEIDRLTGEKKYTLLHFKHFWSDTERKKYIKSFDKYRKLGKPKLKIIKKYEEMF